MNHSCTRIEPGDCVKWVSALGDEDHYGVVLETYWTQTRGERLRVQSYPEGIVVTISEGDVVLHDKDATPAELILCRDQHAEDCCSCGIQKECRHSGVDEVICKECPSLIDCEYK